MDGNLIVAIVIVLLVAAAVAKMAYDLRLGKHCDYCKGSCENCGACNCHTTTIEDEEKSEETTERCEPRGTAPPSKTFSGRPSDPIRYWQFRHTRGLECSRHF